jgi:hypothetical protein
MIKSLAICLALVAATVSAVHHATPGAEAMVQERNLMKFMENLPEHVSLDDQLDR